MNISIDNYTFYVMKNIFIVLFLLNCWFWTLANNNNIFQKILSLSIIRDQVLYLGLWHGWNMFINPSRTNSSLYANIIFYDNTSKILEIFNPIKNIFLDTKLNMRDLKYCENIIQDTNNYIRPMFCQFLSDYSETGGLVRVKSIALLHNYRMVEDFINRHETVEQMQELYRWNRS